MPDVRNLVGNKPKGPTAADPRAKNVLPTSTGSQPEQIDPTNVGTLQMTVEPGSADLTLPDNFNLPAFLSDDGTGPTLANGLQNDYIAVLESLSKNLDQLMAAGVKLGNFYAVKKGQIIPLPTVNYFLMTGRSYLTHYRGSEMELLYCSKDVREENPDPKNRSAHYVALLLVELGDTFIPIRGDFRATKTNGIELAFRALEAASKPEWGRVSEAHKVTMAFRKPFGRVYHTMTTKLTVGKVSGNKFYVTQGSSVPAKLGQMQRLIDLFQDTEWVNDVNAVYQQYMRRCQFLDDAADKHAATAVELA